MKTIFHWKNFFHFSRFFMCFSFTTFDMIFVIMFCENELPSIIVFVFFQVLLYLFCVHPLKRSFEILYVETFFHRNCFSSSNFLIFLCYPNDMIFRMVFCGNHLSLSTMFYTFQVLFFCISPVLPRWYDLQDIFRWKRSFIRNIYFFSVSIFHKFHVHPYWYDL